ncbi:MAG: TspO/MBR family protein [Pseudomonadota bacterium]
MDWQIFIVFMAACCAAGATGSLFPPDDWYFKTLKKPVWTPPAWLFPLAWVVLYISAAVAATWVASVDGAGIALAFWALQIALNTLWTPVFFGLKRLGSAMTIICFLWVAVAATMVTFWQIVPAAGYLFAPYLVWVSYAGALNAWIWRKNAGSFTVQS